MSIMLLEYLQSRETDRERLYWSKDKQFSCVTGPKFIHELLYITLFLLKLLAHTEEQIDDFFFVELDVNWQRTTKSLRCYECKHPPLKIL